MSVSILASSQIAAAVTTPGGVSDPTVDDVSCPSTEQCTASVTYGEVEPAPTPAAALVTFDPTSSSAATTAPIAGQYAGPLACPTVSECAALVSGGVVTFNPATSETPAPVGLPGTSQMYSVACPSSGECIAVGAGGNEVSFDPSAPAAGQSTEVDPPPPPQKIVAPPFCGVGCLAPDLTSVACPTATQCTAVDNAGRTVTFNPASPGTPNQFGLPSSFCSWGVPSGSCVSLACPSSTLCVGVERALEWDGDPLTPAPFLPNPGGAYTPDAVDIACNSGANAVCVIVESNGDIAVAVSAQSSAALPPPTLEMSAATAQPGASVAHVACFASPAVSCSGALELSGVEVLRRGRAIRIDAVLPRHKVRGLRYRRIRLGAHAVLVGGDQSAAVQVPLNALGRHVLASAHRLATTLTITGPHGFLASTTVIFSTKAG